MEAPREIVFSQTENYIEYSRDGRVLRGRERMLIQSKYQEDVYHGNHSSVWGSWFDKETQQWGYACCRATTEHAYCIGTTKNKEAKEAEAAEAAVDDKEVEKEFQKIT